MIVICDMGDWFGPEELRRKVATPAQAKALEKRMRKLAEAQDQSAGSVEKSTDQIAGTDKET